MEDTETPLKKTNRRSTFSSLLGGQYAGYLVEFLASENGVSIVSIHDRLVPDELIQWGQVPKSWELLLSEEIENESNSETSSCLRRETTTILPGVGCGLDSLETIRTTENFLFNTDQIEGNRAMRDPTLSAWYIEHNKILAIDTLRQSVQDTITSARNSHLETIFDLPTTDHRLRVLIEVEITANQATQRSNSKNDYQYKLSPSVPIRTYWERRYNNTDNAVAIDGNGHVDAVTIFNLIGENLRAKESEITKPPKQSDTGKHKSRRIWQLLPDLTIITGPSNNEEENGRWYLEIRLDDNHHISLSGSNKIKTVRREFQGFNSTVQFSEENTLDS